METHLDSATVHYPVQEKSGTKWDHVTAIIGGHVLCKKVGTSCYMHSGTDMVIWVCTGINMQWVKSGRSASQCLSCMQFAFGNTFSIFLKAIVVWSSLPCYFHNNTFSKSQSVHTGTLLTCNGDCFGWHQTYLHHVASTGFINMMLEYLTKNSILIILTVNIVANVCKYDLRVAKKSHPP